MSNKILTNADNLAQNSGFTLIEVVVAIFIIIVGISGLFGLINTTYSYTTSNSMSMEAAYLGKEGIEIVKNIRDSNFLNVHYSGTGNWDDGLTGCVSGCEADYKTTRANMSPYLGDYLRWDGNASFWNYTNGNAGPFKRKITITSGPDVGEMGVAVEVFWDERGRAHSFVVQENLYQWWQ
jgi:prepilin-type N-terminal cleavage/methylation domain-containing protein